MPASRVGGDRACLEVTSLPSCHVLDTSAGDVESLVQRHKSVVVATVQFLALARPRPSCRVQCRFVINDHVLTWQRQLDPNMEWPATLPVSVRDF
jgi:hypothetical protein